MNNKILYLVSFVAGAAVGALATFKIADMKYSKLAQEEIDSVKVAFKQNECKCDQNKEECVDQTTHEEMKSNNTEEVKTNYNNISSKYATSGIIKTADNFIFVISPDEFGEKDDYRVQGLTYFADGVLSDEKGNIIDIDETVSRSALEQFGEYDDDAVMVRNTNLDTDFEILLDPRKYSDVFKR